MPDRPYPLGSLRLFGLENHRLDRRLTIALVILVIASRVAVFPTSIWEQDEAYFAAAVVHFDPADHLPHPPWFPLWIGLGKLAVLLGAGPATALRMVSMVFSVWMIFPLTAMWSTVMPRRLAVGATALFVFSPGPWFFAGRAFSGTTATALLVASLAFWLQSEHRARWLMAGAVMAGAAILIRPQLLPAAVGALLLIGSRLPVRGRRIMVIGTGSALALGILALIISAGGVASLWSAFVAHLDYHAGHLDQVSYALAGSSIARSLGHPLIALAWSLLALVGVWNLVRSGGWRSASPIILGCLLPTLVVIHGLSNPTHARYAVPVLALSCGLVALGLNAVFRRWTWAAITGAVATSAITVGPQLRDYSVTISPPVAMLEVAIDEAESRGSILVLDPTLHAFWLLRETMRPIDATVFIDHTLNLGAPDPDSPAGSIFLIDTTNRASLEKALILHRGSSSNPLVRKLGQDRFLEIVVSATKRNSGDPPTTGTSDESGD